MISYRKIRNDEFESFKRYFVRDYGQEIADNYGYSSEVSLQMAETSIEKSFPNGVSPPNCHLMCIEESKEAQRVVVGFLWYSIEKDEESVFINDFYIYAEYRSRGYGRSVTEILEKNMALDGIRSIKLRVAFTNDRALTLYQELGFSITGHNMIKSIGPQQ